MSVKFDCEMIFYTTLLKGEKQSCITSQRIREVFHRKKKSFKYSHRSLGHHWTTGLDRRFVGCVGRCRERALFPLQSDLYWNGWFSAIAQKWQLIFSKSSTILVSLKNCCLVVCHFCAIEAWYSREVGSSWNDKACRTSAHSHPSFSVSLR